MKTLTKTLILFALALMCAGGAAFAGYTVEQDNQLSKETDAEFMNQYKLSTDKTAAAELESIGKKIAAQVSRKEIKYTFKLVTVDEYNAFAIPGGYVYFTEKLWKQMTPAERAGVIGHEITHVDKRHAIKAYEKNQRRALIYGIGGAVLAGGKYANVASVAYQLGSLSYSRSNEKDADLGGTDLCIAAGLDPTGVYRSMLRLEQIANSSGKKSANPTILSTHPATKDRVKYLRKYLEGKGINVPDIEADYK